MEPSFKTFNDYSAALQAGSRRGRSRCLVTSLSGLSSADDMCLIFDVWDTF